MFSSIAVEKIADCRRRPICDSLFERVMPEVDLAT